MRDLVTDGRMLQDIFKRRLLKEEAADEVKDILKSNYTTFVKELGDNIKDPKFVEAIKSLAKEAPVTLKSASPAVTDLRPTQNEVVLDKSLSYPMKDPATAKLYLTGGVVAVAGKSIVTGGGGKFVIDGHHRWSQLFCINPKAKIKAVDLPISDPMAALKATQLGIAANTGTVPTAEGGGVNLFTIDENTLKKYVMDNIKDGVVEEFKNAKKGNTKEEIAEYIWQNVETLKKTSQPVSGAPVRSVMPQTGDTTDFAKHAPDIEKVA